MVFDFQGIYIPRDPITLSDDDWVYSHLLRKVFRFQYHSQKVIGSLGYIYIYISLYFHLLPGAHGLPGEMDARGVLFFPGDAWVGCIFWDLSSSFMVDFPASHVSFRRANTKSCR